MLALVLALVSSLAPSDCAACAVRENKAVLCADHAREELIAVKRERLCFEKARTDAEKIAALEALAAITDTHANAPSPAIPKALAIGLGDSADQVRRKALSLLLTAQNADASLEVILKARRDLQTRLEKEHSQELKRLKAAQKNLGKVLKDLDAGRKPDLLNGLLPEKGDFGVWFAFAGDLDRSLASFPDERVVAALDEDLGVYSPAMSVLAKLGSRGALANVAGVLERYGESVSTETLRKDGTVAPGPHPGAELIAALGALAARHRIAPPIESERRSSRAWSAWIEANRAAFPAKLPGVGALPVAAR
jgi:hypothetical protein